MEAGEGWRQGRDGYKSQGELQGGRGGRQVRQAGKESGRERVRDSGSRRDAGIQAGFQVRSHIGRKPEGVQMGSNYIKTKMPKICTATSLYCTRAHDA